MPFKEPLKTDPCAGGEDNRLTIQAQIEEIGSKRYTPAGILAVDFTLKHHSVQLEAGAYREVELLLRAIAFDEMAHQVYQLNSADPYRFTGFLSQRGRTKTVVLHVTKIQRSQK